MYHETLKYSGRDKVTNLHSLFRESKYFRLHKTKIPVEFLREYGVLKRKSKSKYSPKFLNYTVKYKKDYM